MLLNARIQTLSVVEVLKSVRTVRQDWRIKTPYQKWCYYYSIGKAALSTIGIPLYEDDQKLFWYSYFPVVYLGLHGILVVFTMYYHIYHGQFMRCLPATAYLGFMFTVRITKLQSIFCALTTLPFIFSISQS